MSTTTLGAVFARPARGSWWSSALIWLVLLTVPLWIGAVGGYTALASRVLIFGLAAMGLNFLLGFTGVMSFGHAAYFGLGCYGAGLTLRYVANSTPLAVLIGIADGHAGRRAVRGADRAATWCVFRHADDRVRGDLLLHRV